MGVSQEDIGKYLSAGSYEELASYFPQYPEPTEEELGCPLTSAEEIKEVGGLAGIPPDIEALVYSKRGYSKEFTRGDLVRIATEELKAQGITNVAIKVSSYQGESFGKSRSVATIWKFRGRKGFLVHLHPDLLWYDEDFIRDTIRHEIEHSRREQDWIGNE